MPDQEYLRRTFDYDPETGILKRKSRARGPAPTKGGTVRYKQTRAEGVKYYTHRLIWVWMTGEDPGDMEIDHINRNTHDNRWSNLRLATRSRNQLNTGNTCIRMRPRSKPYQARITRKGKTVCKSFKTMAEAKSFVKEIKETL